MSSAEMANTFNLGIGLCVVTTPEAVAATLAVFHAQGMDAQVIGRAVPDPDRSIFLPGLKVVGKKDKFHFEG